MSMLGVCVEGSSIVVAVARGRAGVVMAAEGRGGGQERAGVMVAVTRERVGLVEALAK
jgi:hypothetical protein